MPRHEHTPLRPHPDTPRHTPQTWVIDNYRVRSWYYRERPQPGDHVYYMNGTRTRITSVSSTRILLANSCSMRRPYAFARLATWAEPLLRHGRTLVHHKKVTPSSQIGATVYV